MFFLNAQIQYGCSVSSAVFGSFFVQKEKSDQAFKALKLFAGWSGIHNDWIFGVRGFFGSTIDMNMYYGLKGVVGYEFLEDNVQMYMVAGIEKNIGDQKEFGKHNVLVGFNVDFYLSQSIGLGIAVESRPWCDYGNELKKFDDLRLMFKFIIRYI